MIDNENKSLREHIRKVVNPIFNKFLQETNLGSISPYRILFRPNNYRRKASIFINDLKKESTLQKVNSALFKGEVKDVSCSKTNKLIFIELNNNVKIQIGKKYLTAIYNQIEHNKKVVYKITGDSYEEIGDKIYDKAQEIKELLDNSIKNFCSRFDIIYSGIIWDRYEDWIKGEEFIDKLPKDMIIQDTYFKKVYDEGVEFKGGAGHEAGVLVKNYFRNKVIDIPKIEKQLDSFDDKFDKIITAVQYLAENMNTHIPAVKKLGDNAERLADEVIRMNSINNRLFEDI